ncbi:MAG: hypothetical protein ACYSUI_03950 [Planctomycetota bacterium]|jgi:hypothetical protein
MPADPESIRQSEQLKRLAEFFTDAIECHTYGSRFRLRRREFSSRDYSRHLDNLGDLPALQKFVTENEAELVGIGVDAPEIKLLLDDILTMTKQRLEQKPAVQRHKLDWAQRHIADALLGAGERGNWSGPVTTEDCADAFNVSANTWRNWANGRACPKGLEIRNAGRGRWYHRQAAHSPNEAQ